MTHYVELKSGERRKVPARVAEMLVHLDRILYLIRTPEIEVFRILGGL